MEELYLYELKSENEDDPYCSHWYDTDYQTHNYEKARSKILEWKKKEYSDESLTLSDLVYKRVNGLFFGFLDVSKYDRDLEYYVFDHREYLSKYQIGYDCIDYSRFDKEFLEFFECNNGTYLEKTFKFPINAKLLDGDIIESCVDFTIYKKKLGDEKFGKWIFCVEGIKHKDAFDNMKLEDNVEKYGGIFDMSNNYHTETTEGVIDFGHDIVSGWSYYNDDLFRRKFNSALGV